MKSLLMLMFLISAMAVFAQPKRIVECPKDVIASPIRSAKILAKDNSFTVAFKFKALPYVKRSGPWEGLVFANGNGWNDGFRATMTPYSQTGDGSFKMGLRVVKNSGGASYVPVNEILYPGRWYHLAFVLGNGELKSYVNGALSSVRRFEGEVKKASGGFSVGPAGFGVGYYQFRAEDFFVWESALDATEILSLVTGGKTSAKGVAQFLERLDGKQFAAMRTLAWATAGRLVETSDYKTAAQLYSLLAARSPCDVSEDGGNEAAAVFAYSLGGLKIEPAVKALDSIMFPGYEKFEMPRFAPDLSSAVYVSPLGSDVSGDGSEYRPFGSVSKALEASRSRTVRTILLKGGRYMLDKGIRLNARDSGSQHAPLVIASAPGERAILDGGRDVVGFELCNRQGIEVADLNGKGFVGIERPRCWGYALSNKGEKHILDLYEDAVPGELARHPNQGFFKTVWIDSTNSLFRINMPEAAEWSGEKELMALSYMRWLWGDETTRLRIDAVDGAMQIDTGVVKSVKLNHPVKLVNSLKALDEPGEWFLDYDAQKLYYWPRKVGSKVTLSQLSEPIFNLNGAKHVIIRDLVMQHGRSSAISMKDCQHIGVFCNGIRNLRNGIVARGKDIIIAGNCLRSFSMGGISAYGGNRRTLEPSGIRILNNEVSDIERKVRTYCPCVQAEGVGMDTAAKQTE